MNVPWITSDLVWLEGLFDDCVVGDGSRELGQKALDKDA